jgi:hypothetical protein
MVLVSIVVLGAAAFRFNAAMDIRRADVHAGAARLASTLAEGWHDTAVVSTYDPVSRHGADLAITTSATGPGPASGFTSLGTYEIVFNRATYYATLSYQEASETEPAAINVTVAWRADFEAGDVASEARYLRMTTHD